MVTNSPSIDAILRFVNTLEIETGDDYVGAWLRDRGVRPTARTVAQAAEVREALRALLLSHNGVAVDIQAATEVLDAAAQRGRVALRFRDGEALVEPEGRGVDSVLGQILGAVAAAVADGTWQRLKACRAEDCRWAFYDHARNRSRSWCSMAVCGNRTKARRYRARHGSH